MIGHWIRIRRCSGHRLGPYEHRVHAYATVPVVLRIGPAEYEIGEVHADGVAAALPVLLRAVAGQMESPV